MKLVIDRATWLRGEGSGPSKLLRKRDKKKCCIGFLCSALGVPDESMEGVGGSQRLFCDLPSWLTEMPTPTHDPDLFEAYHTNDDPTMDEETREQNITKIFAMHDIQVEFIN